jgi:hypothetical protein
MRAYETVKRGLILQYPYGTLAAHYRKRKNRLPAGYQNWNFLIASN